jgi:hypothetical protein
MAIVHILGLMVLDMMEIG